MYSAHSKHCRLIQITREQATVTLCLFEIPIFNLSTQKANPYGLLLVD